MDDNYELCVNGFNKFITYSKIIFFNKDKIILWSGCQRE